MGWRRKTQVEANKIKQEVVPRYGMLEIKIAEGIRLLVRTGSCGTSMQVNG